MGSSDEKNNNEWAGKSTARRLPNPARASLPWSLYEALVERRVIVRGAGGDVELAGRVEPATGQPFAIVGTEENREAIARLEKDAHDFIVCARGTPEQLRRIQDRGRALRDALAHRDHLAAQVTELRDVNVTLLLREREAVSKASFAEADRLDAQRLREAALKLDVEERLLHAEACGRHRPAAGPCDCYVADVEALLTLAREVDDGAAEILESNAALLERARKAEEEIARLRGPSIAWEEAFPEALELVEKVSPVDALKLAELLDDLESEELVFLADNDRSIVARVMAAGGLTPQHHETAVLVEHLLAIQACTDRGHDFRPDPDYFEPRDVDYVCGRCGAAPPTKSTDAAADLAGLTTVLEELRAAPTPAAKIAIGERLAQQVDPADPGDERHYTMDEVSGWPVGDPPETQRGGKPVPEMRVKESCAPAEGAATIARWMRGEP
jgi:hypothetical protein